MILPNFKLQMKTFIKQLQYFQEQILTNQLYQWGKQEQQSEKLIIFFDEINTNIGVNGIFKELIVDRTVNGEKIPDNITFIAACNPYKLKQKDENKKQKNTLDINNLQVQIYNII
ncbi:hypothetical protein PPERSA_10202 [Pseudocohnilembus persalinus]|uniref:P-loop containing nucleoside triphosphate hydrolase n=1 Tax=Pseudocohnilembus persalinus TaxID=266149 RepID=A0A0V0QM26_PSEPJ|nr:hypothetical protein PPERSA_10202 [Pseudocohnilembus persalinus]|eukprot:KRX03121.1 hypothetical protein PPERSA_10202 [Pseudocohnilembus persalinus]